MFFLSQVFETHDDSGGSDNDNNNGGRRHGQHVNSGRIVETFQNSNSGSSVHCQVIKQQQKKIPRELYHVLSHKFQYLFRLNSMEGIGARLYILAHCKKISLR